MNQWEIGPIFRALSRNKVGAVLIALQMAVTMTIIVNAVFIIVERSALMQRESGVDEANTFYLTSTGFGKNFEHKRVVTEDLDRLRRTPGVVDAIQINAIPISGGGWSMSLSTEPGDDVEDVGTANYLVDDHAINTLDLQLIAGENFTPSEIRWRERNQPDWPATAILTKALVQSLFPDTPWQQTVGSAVYIGEDEPVIIKGIVDKLQAPWIGWDDLEHAMLSPEKTVSESTRYLIRTEPGQRDALMAKVEATLAEAYPNRIIRDVTTLTETRERSYRQHSAMIKILALVMVLLTAITAMGIVGLASFNVNRRKKQIGTRRALGASKGAIIRYFMLENMMISTAGIMLGVALTIGLNMLLIQWFAVSALQWFYIPAGVVLLLVVGQLAVLGPAMRASNIPPAMATRTI
ncbi:FtsX-like permease family protein [Alteromonas pelagimontana]|uniref:FtsX-like permease family protein n=1 Tax=Alteromonas pelagimontana TaxID=1858656 RepID=A0A6M4MKI4_9ALTE|nr:FtsX-like permease family protein [Alteromonas pelagimontana]QJR82586.1 FtsX-like permease family protein [Alteromonas pelagimontana]